MRVFACERQVQAVRLAPEGTRAQPRREHLPQPCAEHEPVYQSRSADRVETHTHTHMVRATTCRLAWPSPAWARRACAETPTSVLLAQAASTRRRAGAWTAAAVVALASLPGAVAQCPSVGAATNITCRAGLQLFVPPSANPVTVFDVVLTGNCFCTCAPAQPVFAVYGSTTGAFSNVNPITGAHFTPARFTLRWTRVPHPALR